MPESIIAFPPGPLPSPCSGVCRMDAASGLCQGCARTLAEIAHWSGADEAYKRAVWQALPQRRTALMEK